VENRSAASVAPPAEDEPPIGAEIAQRLQHHRFAQVGECGDLGYWRADRAIRPAPRPQRH
jgi:hypothetical protein